jgi:hypothetical protein
VLPRQFARLLNAGFSDSPVIGLRTPASIGRERAGAEF